MSSTNNNSTGGGISFVGALALVFIILKLTDVIAWSWWWVLAPLWMSAALGVAMFVVIVVGALIFGGKRARR